MSITTGEGRMLGEEEWEWLFDQEIIAWLGLRKKMFLNGWDGPNRIVRAILHKELLLGIDQLVLVHDTIYWSDIVD